ncbi:hypothetical protein [Marinivivus vitaminiproducens]|uniref:hypothetical protein n=1 Tax=Marinivivus vitaminiproducens TaxID=3035935 RepID=UPI0027A5971F|nr:hypothetical protein P4R82_19390 [Geminicoccaceae bacterium SCSIO 64248]
MTATGALAGAAGWLTPVQAALGPLAGSRSDAEGTAFLALPPLPETEGPAVRVRVDLQVAERDKEAVRAAEGAIVAGLDAFLAGIDPQDLAGVRRLDWLKRQMRHRLQLIAGPAALVQDVLIAEVAVR